MDKHKEKNLNNNVNSTVKTIETTPNDGFVPKEVIQPTNMETYGKYHKGYSTTKTYTTNDPRITRPVAYGICAIFFIIGILSLLLKSWFFGIIFTVISIFSFFESKKDIDKIEEVYKKQGKKVTFDSTEEKEEFKKEIITNTKKEFNDAKDKTFTKQKVNWFIKSTIPIYCIIAIILFAFVTIIVNAFLGFVVLGICVLVGFLYYYILSKICKK